MAESRDKMQISKPPRIKGIVISDEGTKAKCLLPSLAADYSDKQGDIAIWKISKIFECARVTASSTPEFFTNKLISSNPNRSVFIIIMNMEIKRSLYEKVKYKGWTTSWDLITTLTGFGKSSADYITLIEDPTDKETLASLKFRYSMVDLNTRKSTPIPEDFKNTYRKFTKPEYAFEPYKAHLRPQQAFCMDAIIKPSDIDYNSHLNQSYYVRFCSDCAIEASHRNKLTAFLGGNLMNFHTKKLMALFKKECRLGQKVQIFCWEDPQEHFLLHFDLMKGEEISFQCQIEFYPNNDSKL